MKKFCIILILFYCQIATSQNLTDTQKLETTAKIWGFLKYYHPEVAEGKYNWDDQLMMMLPKIKSANDAASLSQLYIDWIGTLGIVKDCRKCKTETQETFDANFDLSWITNKTVITPTLTSILKRIEENRFQGKPHYIQELPALSIEPANEKQDFISDFPDEATRLLGLFQYWNFIEYFYPYKYLTDKKWSDVLAEMIPKYVSVQNKSEYHLAIKELVACLDDSHAFIKFKDRLNIKHFPYKVKNIEDSCVISGAYNSEIGKNENLFPGDIILKINGISLNEEIPKKLKYIPASNSNVKRITAYNEMLILETDNVEITIKRGNEILEKQVNLYNFADFNYFDGTDNTKWKFLPNNIGYVNLIKITHEDIQEMMEKMKLNKGIIFDLRGYPRTIFHSLSRYLKTEKRPFVKTLIPNLNYPGKFIWGKPERTGITRKDAYGGKIVILVDDQSISLSEYTAMALQNADNVVTVGSQTYGADGNVTIFNYLGGFSTAISGLGFYYPDGRQTQRVGVKIDHIVQPSIEGLMLGKDEILEKAIELITKN